MNRKLYLHIVNICMLPGSAMMAGTNPLYVQTR